MFLENILNDEYVAPLFNFESDLTLKEITVGDVGIRKINAFEFFVFTHLDQNYQLSNKFYNLPDQLDNSNLQDNISKLI